VAQLRLMRDARGRRAADDDGLPSPQGLSRWLDKWDEGGVAALLPKPSARPDEETKLWHPLATQYFARGQKPSLRWVHEQIEQRWQPALGPRPPSYDQIRRFFERYSTLKALQGRHTGSALRSRTHYVARDWSQYPAFFEVHADGWNTHFLVPREKDGKWETLEVWHFHCTRTRYVTPFGIGYSESRDVILAGLRECIRVGGVPAIWQTDSTGSVKNRQVSGFSKARVKGDDDGEDLQALADRLGVTVVHPQEVGNSQANGIAENFNTWLDRESRVLASYMNPDRHDEKTFVRVRRLLDQLEKAGERAATVGASDEERARPAQLRGQLERLGRGLVFASEAHARQWLQGLVQKWNERPHRGLPRVRDAATGRQRHMTPAEALEEALRDMRAAGQELHHLTEAQMTDLFREHRRKKVYRGAVTLHDQQRYSCPALAHIEGTEVLVVPNEMDAHQVWVKDLEGRLIGVAELQSAKFPRATTTVENADLKRAQARIRHREQQIEQIEREMAPLVLEHAPTGAALAGMWSQSIGLPAAADVVEVQARALPDPLPGPLPELRADAPTPTGRAVNLPPLRRPLAPHEDPEVIARVMREIDEAEARRAADMAAQMAKWHADVAAADAAKAAAAAPQQPPPADPSFDRAAAG
jgi:putative transposase